MSFFSAGKKEKLLSCCLVEERKRTTTQFLLNRFAHQASNAVLSSMRYMRSVEVLRLGLLLHVVSRGPSLRRKTKPQRRRVGPLFKKEREGAEKRAHDSVGSKPRVSFLSNRVLLPLLLFWMGIEKEWKLQS